MHTYKTSVCLFVFGMIVVVGDLFIYVAQTNICTRWREYIVVDQSILIHTNSGFRGVGVPYRKLGSKICKKKYLKLGGDVTFQAASFL